MVLVIIAGIAIGSANQVLSYGFILFSFLIIKGLAAITSPEPAKPKPEDDQIRVAAILTVYNEDPAILRQAVKALRSQPNLTLIMLVDDGSTDRTTRKELDKIQKQIDRVIILKQNNSGKRHALRNGIHALNRIDTSLDFIVTVDSDTVLLPGALLAVISEMRQYPKSAAITGMVRAHNWKKNFLTRVQDIRYASSFLWERAAYSRTGAVLCVCGAFTLWRAKLLDELVDKLITQRFLGEECTFGDDRHLSNLALKEGWEVRFSEGAVAETLVPERWTHWVRQQTRWSKSFMRESVWSVGHLPLGIAWTIAAFELASTFIFTVMLIFSMSLIISNFGFTGVGTVLGWLVIMSWARSVRWIEFRVEDLNFNDVMAGLIFAPIYGGIHILLVVPLRVYALATLARTSWGTRSKIEVTAG